MKYYKYIAELDAANFIASGTIKFATLSSLNDPTELLPKIYEAELRDSLRIIRRQGYRKADLEDLERQEKLFKLLSPETMVIDAPKSIEDANRTIQLPVYNNFEYLKQMFRKTIDLMGSRCGIFCVSKRWDSLPMWAHYANSARGFVVEFDNLEEEFKGDETGILNRLYPVKYTQERSGVSFKRNSYNSIFFEKDVDWNYECEARVVTNLDSCNDTGGIYTKHINPTSITKIIIGWRNSKDEVRNIRKGIAKINRKVKIEKSEIIEGKIKTA